MSVGERTEALTPTEFRVLAALVARPGEVVRRRELVAAAWPDGAIVNENTLDAYVGRLRRKLRALGVDEQIETGARRRLRVAVNLRSRVTLATVVTLGVGLAVVGVALNLLLANRLMADADTVLANRAGALLATLDTSGPRLRVHDNGGDAVLDEQAWVFDAQRPRDRAPADRRRVRRCRDVARAPCGARPAVDRGPRAAARRCPPSSTAGASERSSSASRSPRTSGPSTSRRSARSCCACSWSRRGALLARRAVGDGAAAGGGHDDAGRRLERARPRPSLRRSARRATS